MINIKYISIAFKEVFKRRVYIILFIIIALTFFLSSVWLARRNLLAFFSWPDKLRIFWSLILDLSSTFTPSSIFLVIILSILSALNIVMMIFYIKRRVSLQKNTGVGVIGIVLGFLGVGCASCGSLVLSSIFGLSATVAFIGVLPWHGLEFGFLGIFILLISIYLIAKKIQDPLTCKIN